MDPDRRSILQMLAEGKVSADEAERLLTALERNDASTAARPASNGAPKYLRVLVDTDDVASGPTKVNIRVPMALLRAGVRLTSLIPPLAREQINAEMARNGVPFDIAQLRPENLEDMIDQINDLQVDVDQERTKVRVFCE
ncbi:MAG TPA: hypothetical protein VGM25_02840 [Caulobacteraceae bacterium]|jgi:hypothetical protein